MYDHWARRRFPPLENVFYKLCFELILLHLRCLAMVLEKFAVLGKDGGLNPSSNSISYVWYINFAF